MSLYSDINTSKSNKVPKVYDIDAVWQSFSNFMKTRKRQRFFRPDLGNSLSRDLLFELEYEDAVFVAIGNLTRELEYWDPRIEVIVNASDVKINYDEKTVEIIVGFKVKGFENKIIQRSLTL